MPSSHDFESIYRDHHRRVFALLLRILRDSTAATEVTQDVFVEAWQGLARFRGESAVSTWLHRIAVNRALTWQRDDRRRVARLEDPALLDRYRAALRQSMPDTSMELEEAIANLPEGARTVFILFEIEGYQYQEIAEMLDVAIGTVRSQLHRARQLFTEAMHA